MKAYIFDLDGTLLDSMGVWEDIDIDFLKRRGFGVPPDYADKIVSMSFYETAVYTIERFGLSDSAESLMREWNDMAIHAYENTIQMKPYAKEYLIALRGMGVKLAVATSASAELYIPALRNHGIIDLFHTICTTDEAGYGKSRPDVFHLAAQRLDIPPCDCTVFEDILVAVQSAKKAGMNVYGVYDKASKNDWEQIKQSADGVVLDFRCAPLPR